MATVPYNILRAVHNNTNHLTYMDKVQIFMPIDQQWCSGFFMGMETRPTAAAAAAAAAAVSFVRIALHEETEQDDKGQEVCAEKTSNDFIVVPYNLVRAFLSQELQGSSKRSIDVGNQVEVMLF